MFAYELSEFDLAFDIAITQSPFEEVSVDSGDIPAAFRYTSLFDAGCPVGSMTFPEIIFVF